MNIIRRVHQSLSPKGSPQHSDSETLNPPAYYSVSPTHPKFQIGWSWYPGISKASAQMHNKVGIDDTSPGSLRLVPPTIPHFSVMANRSIMQGARFNAQYGLPNITTRIVMPTVPRR